MAKSNIFKGFSEEMIKFYVELEYNNNKEWFEQNKKRYETFVLEPAKQFVMDIGERLKEISPNIYFEPKIDKSIFRIYKDTRFSKDKAPYKTHLGILFWEGNRKKLECSGYYFQFDKDSLYFGAGLYMLPKELLEIYRKAVISQKHSKTFIKAVNEITKDINFKIENKYYKQIPRGFDKEHENAEYLLYNGIYASYSTEIPDDFFSSSFIDYSIEKFKHVQPLHKWLVSIFEG